MTQENPDVLESPVAIQPEPDNLGSLLAMLRKKKGLSVADVSNQIKFSAMQITALECQDWSALPQGFVLKGLVRKYGQMLGADEQQLLDLLKRQTGAVVERQELKSLQSSADFQSSEPYESSRSGTGMWLLVIILVIIVIAIYGYSREWFTLEDIGLEGLKDLF
ncbi:MAG: helix-turn-helix domain-containing protein [Alcaligenaceae bacterium]|nr:helix-turn-helix domain-containing protein [Alcaligenaceae bacterium]